MSVVSTGVWAGACEEPQEELRTLLWHVGKYFRSGFSVGTDLCLNPGSVSQHAAVSVTRRRPCALWSGDDSGTRCVGRSRVKGEAAST